MKPKSEATAVSATTVFPSELSKTLRTRPAT